MDKVKSMWGVGVAIIILLILVATISYYQGKVANLETRISDSQTTIAAKEAEAKKWKADAVLLASKMVELNKKVKGARTRMEGVQPPQTSVETKDRLEALGLTPEVKCE